MNNKRAWWLGGLVAVLVVAALAALPEGWEARDIPELQQKGSTVVEEGKWTIKAGGWDIWGDFDGFHYASRTLKGDGVAEVKVVSLVESDGWAKAGLMIREKRSPAARHAFALLSAGNGCDFQYRPTEAGESLQAGGQQGEVRAPCRLRLERKGDKLTAACLPDGATEWRSMGEVTLDNLKEEVFLGLAVTSHSEEAMTTAVLEDLKITP